MSAQAQANFKSRKIKLSTQIKGRRAVRPNACNLISDLLLYIKGSVLEAGEKELSFSRLSCSALPSSFSQMCLIKNDLYRPTYSPFLLRWGGKTTLGAEWLDLWLLFFLFPSWVRCELCVGSVPQCQRVPLYAFHLAELIPWHHSMLWDWLESYNTACGETQLNCNKNRCGF